MNADAAKQAFQNARSIPLPQPWTVDELGGILAGTHPHYRLIRILGSGGMGAVYLAEDMRLSGSGRHVALKFLRWDQWSEAPHDRFWKEPGFLKSLQHPNIAQVLDEGRVQETNGGIPFFAMEYVDGGNLADRLSVAGKLPLAEVLAIAKDIGSALQHAHDRGTISRDVKANNIILRRADGRSILTDFGIARQTGVPLSTLSQFGIPGTPGHVAPEVKAGAQATERADQFSFAATLYQTLTGELPDVGYMKVSLQRGPDPDPRFENIDEVFARALSQDPKQRYASVSAFVQAFQDAAAKVQQAVVAPAPPAPVVRTAEKPGKGAVRELQELLDPRVLELHTKFLAAWPTNGKNHWCGWAAAQVPIRPKSERWEIVDEWKVFEKLPTGAQVEAMRRRLEGIDDAVIPMGLLMWVIAVCAVGEWRIVVGIAGLVLLGYLVSEMLAKLEKGGGEKSGVWLRAGGLAWFIVVPGIQTRQ